MMINRYCQAVAKSEERIILAEKTYEEARKQADKIREEAQK
jgi:hypothetical protein